MAYTPVAMPSVETLHSILENSIFAELDKHDVEKIARILECGSTKAGEYVYQMGEPKHSMFIIVSGEVTVCDPMKHTVITKLIESDTFGMLSLFFDNAVSPDIRAAKDSTFLILDAGTLRMIEVSDPTLAIDIFRCIRKALGELISNISPVIMRLAL